MKKENMLSVSIRSERMARRIPEVPFCRHCYIYTVGSRGDVCEMCRSKGENLAVIQSDRMRGRALVVGLILAGISLFLFMVALYRAI